MSAQIISIIIILSVALIIGTLGLLIHKEEEKAKTEVRQFFNWFKFKK
jgi:hypothetical protein